MFKSIIKLAFILSFFILLIHAEQQLKVGVKKRVDDCKIRSKKGDLLHVHYKGMFNDGTEFDNSYPRDNPLTFTLGSNQVIKGWDMGLLNMCVGEKRRLVVPPSLAYGSEGASGRIPPNSVLTFDVELVDIERRTEL